MCCICPRVASVPELWFHLSAHRLGVRNAEYELLTSVSIPRACAWACTALQLAGCASYPRVNDTVDKFDQGSHTLSASEMGFLHAAQRADCDFLFYTRALDFVSDPAPKPASSLVSAQPCVPEVLTNQDVAIREKLLSAITLYADQIQAVAAGAADKTLSADARFAGGDFTAFLASTDMSKAVNSAIPATVDQAVTGLFDMVMDAANVRNVQAAAHDQAKNLAAVVELLKSENTQVAAHMTAKAVEISHVLDIMIASIKKTGVFTEVKDPAPGVKQISLKPADHYADHYHVERANDYVVLLAAIEARSVIQSIDSVGLPASTITAAAPSPSPAPSPGAVPEDREIVCKAPGISAKSYSGEGSIVSENSVAREVNATLDALLVANNAIAHAHGAGCAAAAVSDLLARAEAAQSMVAALKK